MKTIVCWFLALLTVPAFAQQPAEILSASQVKTILNDSVRKVFHITFPVFRVYQYKDLSGEFLCVLTESHDSISSKDTFNRAIKALDLKWEQDKWVKVWELNDHLINNGRE